jgi:membrane protease YdiL (CAAX protease family)
MDVEADVERQSGRYDPATIPQFTILQLVGYVLLPIAWWFFILYVVAPFLLPSITTSEGEMNAWALLMLSSLGYLFEFFLALYIFRREGYRLRLSALRSRINWRLVRGWKTWGLVLLLFVVGFGLSMFLSQTNRMVAEVLPPPDWFPASQNPLKDVEGIEDALPGVAFQGNFLFLVLFLFTGIMNIVGEDLYYRGALIPKMHGLFGKWAWLAGGIIWPIKHIYVWWNAIGNALILGLVGAYVFGLLGSLPIAMLIHFIANSVFTWPTVISAVLGG